MKPEHYVALATLLCTIGLYCAYFGDFYDYPALSVIGYALCLPTAPLLLLIFLVVICFGIISLIQESRWKRMAKAEWNVGSVFAIPLGDGSYALGQVISRKPIGIYNEACCSFFDKKVTSLDEGKNQALEAADCISILRFLGISLDKGTWPVIERRRMIIGETTIPEFESITMASVRDFDLENFLKVYLHSPTAKPNLDISDYLNVPGKAVSDTEHPLTPMGEGNEERKFLMKFVSQRLSPLGFEISTPRPLCFRFSRRRSGFIQTFSITFLYRNRNSFWVTFTRIPLSGILWNGEHLCAENIRPEHPGLKHCNLYSKKNGFEFTCFSSFLGGLFEKRSRDEIQVIEEFLELFPEILEWWETQKVGPHLLIPPSARPPSAETWKH